MAEFEVREARTPAEVEAAGQATVEANAEFAPAVGADHPVWVAYVRAQADAASRAAAGTLLVAVDRATGAVLGTATLYLNEAPGSTQWRPGDAILRFLAVRPDARGLGIGRALFDACLDRTRAAGRPRLALHTTVWQEAARTMYERAGFVREPEGDATMGTVTILAYAREL
jgi:GNAT superfamily N-acetyltransferase